MLDFCSPENSFADRRLGRRSFLRVGSLGLGGISLAQYLSAAAAGADVLRDKSVIFLFLHGGPSQIETFDPKPEAPVEIRSATGDIATAIPGIRFGATLPKLAARADRFTIVRSFATGDGNHDIKPIVGKASAGANLGSIYARLAGGNDPRSGMPTNVALFPQSVVPESQPEQKNFGRFDSAGALGAASAPFVPGSGGDLQTALTLSLPPDRFENRRELLSQLDAGRRVVDRLGLLAEADRFRQQAYDTILGGVASAFKLDDEPQEVVRRYDTAGLVRAETIDPKWNNHKFYVDHNRTLGKLLLLARRLIERDCRFVTVTTNFVWDNHADVNNADMVEGMRYCSIAFDHAVAMLLDDLRDRGLSDKVLLVAVGEMGRTPRINSRGGRDHWGGLAPLLLAGGGVRPGHVLGQSTRNAGEPLSTPVTIPNLVSTVMHTLFEIPQLRLRPDVPRELEPVLFGSDPIPGLA